MSRLSGILSGLSVLACSGVVYAGELDPPPGPVAPTPGPEPRTPINATNTPGDADSVYKITTPGSYYLTEDVLGETGKHGIEIASSGVSVDLMGFEVRGVLGSLSGIYASQTFLYGIAVANGSITQWGVSGIDLYTFAAARARVEAIRAVGNGADGIRVSSGSIVESCVSDGNSSVGVFAEVGCTVRGCVARENGTFGINVVTSCSIQQCAATLNGSTGIVLGTACSAADCTSENNGGAGFQGGSSSVVRHCTAYSNDTDGINCSVGARVIECNSASNLGDGIEVSGDAFVSGNTCDSNGFGSSDGAGIHVTSSDNRIEGNNCTDADRGIDVDLAGSIIVRNTCSGNTTNWDLVAGNVCLVVNATASAAISGNSGGSAPGSTDPSANFTY